MNNTVFDTQQPEITFKHAACFILKKPINPSDIMLNGITNSALRIMERSLNSSNKHLYFIYLEELFWTFFDSFNIIATNIMYCFTYHLRYNDKSIKSDVILSKLYIDFAKSVLDIKTINSKCSFSYKAKILASKILIYFPSNDMITYFLSKIETETDESMKSALQQTLRVITYKVYPPKQLSKSSE